MAGANAGLRTSAFGNTLARTGPALVSLLVKTENVEKNAQHT